jgi:hypothetical protein
LIRLHALAADSPASIRITEHRFENQQIEAQVKCQIPNRMASLGLPISERDLQG